MCTLANGTLSRLDALKEGDQIVAATADGSLTTDTVSILSIAHPQVHVDHFLTLTTTANASITLTPEHHLPVGASCCTILKKAKDVGVGEQVWFVAEGKAATTTVTSAAVTKAKGLHSPVLTKGGFPVVDGIVTAFDSIEKVTIPEAILSPLPSLSSLLFLPLPLSPLLSHLYSLPLPSTSISSPSHLFLTSIR